MRVSQIKRGVRVRITKLLDEDIEAGLKVDQIGTILDESSMPWVQFDGFTRGHSQGSPTTPNSVATMLANQISLVEDHEALAKLKATKPVWTKKSPNIHPKSTKADLAKLLQETVDQLNDIGTKWAKAQNTINTLKKKVAK